MRRRVLVLLVGSLLAAGCGQQGSEDGASSGPAPTGATSAGGPAGVDLVGLGVSSPHTTALVEVGDGAAVVDGAAPVGAARRLRASWSAGGGRQEAVDDERPPLVFPTAWADGSSLYVAGQECPEVDLDLVGDIDQVPFTDVCGRPAPEVIRRLDLDGGTWSVALAEVPAGPGGRASVLATSGPTVLTRTDDHSVFAVDLARGEVAELPEASTAGSTLSAACPLPGERVLVVVTDLPAEGLLDPRTGEVPLSALVVEGREVTRLPVPVPGDAPDPPFAPLGCWPVRGVLGPAGGTDGGVDALVLDEGGALAWDELALPPPAEGGGGTRVEAYGSSLVAWVPDGDGLLGWRHGEGGWSRIGARVDRLDPPHDALVRPDGLLALEVAHRGDGTARYEVVRG